MPLLKSRPSTPPPAPAGPTRPAEALIAILTGGGAEAERRDAALDLSAAPQAAEALAAALGREQAPRVREAIITALASMGTQAAAHGLAAFLGSEDVALRNDAMYALRRMGAVAGAEVAPLLDSLDQDERLFAVRVLETSGHPEAPAWICRLLEHEREINVCLAAAYALGECAGADVAALLRDLVARFPEDAFVAFVADQACRRVTSGSGG